jgi:hypothetical protein
MKTVAGRFILALVLFAGAAACGAEARLARRMADAHERLATLHYDIDESLEEAATVADRLTVRIASLGNDVRRHRATVDYWQSRYDALTALQAAVAAGAGANADPEVLLVEANAAFRVGQHQGGNRQIAVQRLDDVVQAYAVVLRAAPGHPDAAYNYEYVARVRDTMAKARQTAPAVKEQKRAANEPSSTGDLPLGPTIHGRPGAPPPEAAAGQRFQIIVPKEFDEREDKPTANPGGKPQRRG